MSQFTDLINMYMKSTHVTVDKDGKEIISGSIDTEESYKSFLNDMRALDISFSTRSCSTPRSQDELQNSKGMIRFESKRSGFDIPFFGTPFLVERTFYFKCTFGKKYYRNPATNSEQMKMPAVKRRRVLPSKKIGCPAKMYVKQLRLFPDYKVKDSHWRNKKKMVQLVKQHLKSSTPPESLLRFLILISPESCHSHPILPMKIHPNLHPDLVREIHHLVKNNICSVKLIKPRLSEYVKAMFLNSDVKPSPLNTSYFPSNKIIYNHVRKAMADLKEISSELALDSESEEHWIEIISSHPRENNLVDDHILQEAVSIQILSDKESTLALQLTEECEDSEIKQLQESCRNELSQMTMCLELCTDKVYLQDLLASLEHLSNFMETNNNINKDNISITS